MLWTAGAFLCLFSSSCFLFKISSRRDRFVKQVIAPKTQPLTLLSGQSDGRAVPLGPGDSLVLALNIPTYTGYSEALTVYVPKRLAHQSKFRVFLGDRKSGPWTLIGLASSTRSFDINGTPLPVSHYVRIEVLPSSEGKLWLDAIKLRVHTKTWQPPIHFKTKMKPEEANKRFQKLWQAGQRFFERRKYKQARNTLRAALSLRHKHASVLYMLGGTYHALEEHYQAIRHYRWALQYGKPSREHLEEIANSYIALKAYKKALPYVERCMSIAPLYPACYYQRLHLASRKKNRVVLDFYAEMYRIVKQRTHIARRKWTLQKFLGSYFSKRAPIISVYPQMFTCRQHLEWASFLLRLFPQDQQAVIFFSRSGLDTRWQLLKKPTQKMECRYYRAQYFHQIKQHKRSISVLQELESQERRHQWLARSYLLHGQILERMGQKKEAQRIYQKAHKRLGSTWYGRPFLIKVVGKSITKITAQTPTKRRRSPAARHKFKK